MKPRPHTPAEAARWMEFQSLKPPRMARCWLIHWPQIEPTIKRYQDAVPLSRVLQEHAAAVAAEPLED